MTETNTELLDRTVLGRSVDGRSRYDAHAKLHLLQACVKPGRVATDRIKFLDAQKALRENRPVDEVTTESADSIPLGRYGEPQKYADMVCFLASARASYITGSVIQMAG
jgi:NAD(P)-dependent dehydrogenase (short-subunit alcohol dehydrogenase family)